VLKIFSAKSQGLLFGFIAFCCLLETLCFTYLLSYPEIRQVNTVFYFVSGLAICILCLWFSTQPKHKNEIAATKPNKQLVILKSALALGYFIFIVALLISYGNRLFPTNPIQERYADMLPVIKTACERWMHGEEVYKPIGEIWQGIEISYLPAMWMPFAPSIWLNVDMRWTSLFLTAICIGALLILLARAKNKKFFSAFPVFVLLIFLLVKYYTWEEHNLYKLTQEWVPATWYLLLFIALMFENDWLIGSTIALCCLSRFSIVPFLPFYFLWLVFNKNYKGILKQGAAILIWSLVIFIIPFFIKQPMYFLEIPFKYLGNVEKYWQINHYNLLNNRGLGLAFVTGYEGRTLLAWLSNILLLLVGLGWLIASFSLLRKNGIHKKNIWVMAGFKLSLLVFYNFISMPYLYLFVVPTLVSYPLLLAVLRETDF
jgi:hypothetical protein